MTARCGADNEWGVHIAAFARSAGLSGAHVRSLTDGAPGDACWDQVNDRGVLAAVDELMVSHDLEERSWSALLAAVGQEGCIDVLLLCGWYHAISFLARASRLPL